MAKYERFIDRFFDENNFENVQLQDEDGKDFEFEQSALDDYEGKYYVILDPVTEIEGIGEDEVYVFLIDEAQDGLVLIDDIDVVQGVFNVYYEMLDDEEE